MEYKNIVTKEAFLEMEGIMGVLKADGRFREPLNLSLCSIEECVLGEYLRYDYDIIEHGVQIYSVEDFNFPLEDLGFTISFSPRNRSQDSASAMLDKIAEVLSSYGYRTYLREEDKENNFMAIYITKEGEN